MQMSIEAWRKHKFVCNVSSTMLSSFLGFLFFLIYQTSKSKTILATKARFARVRAARGWNPAYQGSCIDPMDQSHPLNPTSKGHLLILDPAIRLLVKDKKINCKVIPWGNPHIKWRWWEDFFLFWAVEKPTFHRNVTLFALKLGKERAINKCRRFICELISMAI